MGNSRNLANLLGTGSTIATAKIADDAITAAKIATDAVVADGLSSSAIASGDLPTGTILQVVQKQDSSTSSSTSTSYTNTGVSGLNLSITPKFTSSKILMTVHMQLECGSGSNSGGIIFARDPSGTPTYFANSGTSSGLGNPFNSSNGVSKVFLSQGYGGINGQCTSHAGIDTPSTTSAVTYGVLWGTNNSTVYYNKGAGGYTLNSSIILIEIAG